MERCISCNVTGFSASTNAVERADLPRRRHRDDILVNCSLATSQFDDMATAAPQFVTGFVNGVLHCFSTLPEKIRFAGRRGRFRQLA
jgi:hypothetical protein